MIDDATLHLLKVEVERIVRPIRATRARKDRMREELWSHLVGRAEQFFDDTPDREWAARQSVALLGDRARLAAELQASVPAIERVLWTPLREPRWLERAGCKLWGVREPEGPWQSGAALRNAGLLAAAICLLLNPVVQWSVQAEPNWAKILLFSAVFCALALAVYAALLPFACGVFRRGLGDANAEPTARLALRGALLGVVMLAAGPAFAWLTGEYFEFAARDTAIWAGVSLATPPVWAMLLHLAALDRRHWREWECLVPDGE